MTKEKLQELGLSEKEARTYLALVELGPSVVTGIAEKSGVNRSTAYVVLGTLAKRGLVHSAERRGGQLFSPTSPERLIEYLEGTAKQYADLAGVARKLAPELKALSKRRKESVSVTKPNVQFFEGREGIQSVYEDTLGSLERIRAYTSVGEYGDEKGRARVIFLDTPRARNEVLHAKEQARSAFLASKRGVSFSPEINVYDNKIVFISPAEKIAFVVESRELAATLKTALAASRKEYARASRKTALEPGAAAV